MLMVQCLGSVARPLELASFSQSSRAVFTESRAPARVCVSRKASDVDVTIRRRWVDAFKGARSDRLRGMVAEAAAKLEQFEKDTGQRSRARRPADYVQFLLAVEVIISNLAHACIHPPETGRLAILTGNPPQGRSRYRNPALGKPLRDILSRLEDLGYLDLAPSFQRGRASSIAPTPWMRLMVTTAGLKDEDFARINGEETIILRAKAPRRMLVDYGDTEQTVAILADMEALNGFLSGADISFVDDGLGLVDLSDRSMRRHFQAASVDDRSFDKGGRLFGGWWQNLKSARRGGIRIGGERVAVLDYSSMFPRLAYAEIGAVSPEGDLYAIPGLERHRKAVKMAMNCLLFDENRYRFKWPEELVVPVAEGGSDAVMPEGWSVARMRAAILQKHPGLRPALGCGLGMRLMFKESVVLIEVLKELRGRGIVALGLHDGLIVPCSRASEVQSVMVEIAHGLTGHTFPVTIKAL